MSLYVWRSDYFEETTVTFGRLYTGSDMTLIMGHQQKERLRSNTYRDKLDIYLSELFYHLQIYLLHDVMLCCFVFVAYNVYILVDNYLY
jgi:hypothetical protein